MEDNYDPWTEERRNDVERRYQSALELLANLELQLGQLSDAAQHYYQLLEIDPYHESAHAGLMRYFARRHEIGRAIDQFQTFAQRLKQEIGAEPSDDMLELYQAMRTQVKKSAARSRITPKSK